MEALNIIMASQCSLTFLFFYKCFGPYAVFSEQSISEFSAAYVCPVFQVLTCLSQGLALKISYGAGNILVIT